MTTCWRDDFGELHRDGGLPAVERANGSKEWWVNGVQHRDDGLPAVERASGTKEWWVNDELHRDGGLPAVERADGTKQWWVNGKCHRDGGLPAIEWSDGTKEWRVNGTEVSEEQAKLIHRIKMKRIKRSFWKWYDITYGIDKPAFKARMMRDLNALENDLGYQLS